MIRYTPEEIRQEYLKMRAVDTFQAMIRDMFKAYDAVVIENKALQKENERLTIFEKDSLVVLDWLLDEGSELFVEPCLFQDNMDYDSRCGGHMETDTGAWICGNEEKCPLGIQEHIYDMLGCTCGKKDCKHLYKKHPTN